MNAECKSYVCIIMPTACVPCNVRAWLRQHCVSAVCAACLTSAGRQVSTYLTVDTHIVPHYKLLKSIAQKLSMYPTTGLCQQPKSCRTHFFWETQSAMTIRCSKTNKESGLLQLRTEALWCRQGTASATCANQVATASQSKFKGWPEKPSALQTVMTVLTLSSTVCLLRATTRRV